MYELIAHTAPDDIIPSKNHEIYSCVWNNSCDGEKIKIDRNHPPWNEKHIGHDINPDTKSNKGEINGISISPITLTLFLNPLKIELNTIIFINP